MIQQEKLIVWSQRQELLSGKNVYLSIMEKGGPQFADPGKNACLYSGLLFLDEMFMCVICSSKRDQQDQMRLNRGLENVPIPGGVWQTFL